MAEVEISWDGLDKFMEIVDPVRFVNEIDRAMDRASSLLRDETKRMPAVSAKTTGYAALGIPVDTGRMRQSIQKRKIGTFEYEVYADTNYSAFIHEGTGRMPARPFFTWLLNDFGGVQMLEIVLQGAMERVVNP